MSGRWRDTLEAAKAAAQADYEARILSALAPVDVMADPRVVTLAKAPWEEEESDG